MVINQESNYWILGYSRDIDYEKERKRRKARSGEQTNTLYKCESCNLVWENYSTHKTQFVNYSHMPSYGLKRLKCKLCKGESNG